MEAVVCPVCGQQVEREREVLESIGISEDNVHVIREYASNGALAKMVALGQVVDRYLQPERAGVDAAVTEALCRMQETARLLLDKQRETIERLKAADTEEKRRLIEEARREQQELVAKYEKEERDLRERYVRETEAMRSLMADIHEKLVTPGGKGAAGELSLTRELQATVPVDHFDDRKRSAGGTDTIARVKDKGAEVGVVTISVKDEERWRGDFLTQLERNMREDGAKWAILATKAFPTNALSNRAYLYDGNVIIAKLEYVPLVYLGLREAVICEAHAHAHLEDAVQRMQMHDHLMETLKSWLDGEKFSKVGSDLESAKQAAEETESLMVQLQKYVEQKTQKVRELQHKVQGSIASIRDALADLQHLLWEPQLAEGERFNEDNSKAVALRM